MSVSVSVSAWKVVLFNLKLLLRRNTQGEVGTDLTILEVIPRNSPSVMKYLVNDVNSFAHCNNIQLNPSKCKLMRVDFLHYNSCYSQPIAVGGSGIESGESFKLLGVYISSDLSWSTHCDYSYFEKGCRKKCTRQSRKVLWVALRALFFKEI